MYQLANTLRMQSRSAEAAPLLEGAVAVMRRKYKDDDGDRLEMEETLARLYREQGRLAEPAASLKLRFSPCAGAGVLLAATLETLALLATIDCQQGKFPEGEVLAREAVEAYRRSKQDTWQRYEAEALLGASLSVGASVRRGGTASSRGLLRNRGAQKQHPSGRFESPDPSGAGARAVVSQLG